MGLENRDLSDFEKRLAKFRSSLPLLSGPRPSVTGHLSRGKTTRSLRCVAASFNDPSRGGLG